jgi:uncharacterized repeat protein (TIGR01451 family)
VQSKRSLFWMLAATLVVALMAPAVAAAVDPPDQDPFYQPPAGFETEAPGTVLKSRPIQIQGPPFFPTPQVNAWQLLFRSTDTKNNPIAAVTTIAVPSNPYAGTGAPPLVSYQMAIDGLGSTCNPSYELQTGTEKELAVAAPMLERGWIVNIPDFEGTQMHYGAGRIAAHVVLDSLRAAYNFPSAGVGPGNPLGLAGYSGGGQGTAWAVEQQPSYAPELQITAAAPGGVPADLNSVARANDGGPFMGLVLGAAIGVNRAYPEMQLDSLFNASGLSAEQQMSSQCVENFATSHPFGHFSDFTKPEYPDPISLPQIQSVLLDNRLPKATPTAPIYLWHSTADEIIPVASADLLAAAYCSAGVDLTYQREAGGDHNSEAAAGAPEAISYLEAHFNGQSPPSTCGINTSADTRIDSGPSGAADDDSATFTYSDVPHITGATFECSLDDTDFVSCPAAGVTYSGLTPGEHTFAVRSVTAAGNRDVSPATRSWNVTGTDLAVSVSDAPDPVSVGGQLTYTIQVDNAGPDTATGVTLTDRLAKGVRFRSARSTQGRCVLGTKTVVQCNLAGLDAGTGVTVTLVTVPTRAGNLSNTASVAASQPLDRNLTNNSATVTTTVQR